MKCVQQSFFLHQCFQLHCHKKPHPIINIVCFCFLCVLNPRILFPEIQPKLASLLKEGYKVGRNLIVANVLQKSQDYCNILYPRAPMVFISGFPIILAILLQVVFFTNQMGIAKGKLRPEVFKSKVEDILATLKLPVQVERVVHHCHLSATNGMKCYCF